MDEHPGEGGYGKQRGVKVLEKGKEKREEPGRRTERRQEKEVSTKSEEGGHKKKKSWHGRARGDMANVRNPPE